MASALALAPSSTVKEPLRPCGSHAALSGEQCSRRRAAAAGPPPPKKDARRARRQHVAARYTKSARGGDDQRPQKNTVPGTTLNCPR